MSPPRQEKEVVDAIHAMRRLTGEWPTPHAIAGRAGLEVEEVRETLRELRESGELVCRKRGKSRQWMPAGER